MFQHHTTLRHGLLTSVAAVTLVLAAPAAAQDTARDYDLPVQSLGKSLGQVAQRSGRQVVVSSSLVRGKTAPALKGQYTADQAYAALLAGQGLKVTPVGDMLVLQPAGQDAGLGERQAGAAEALSEIVVTGTRIRGAAPVGSNLIAIGREDIEASGYATTQQIVQSIPQNFGGGPNEGTMYGTGRNGSSANLAAGSGVNLRGLGASSTLVLLNGSRPPMGGRTGVFADISLVPSTAIERIEVLADGASALYGSDAVAGVVNVVFRDRYEGLTTQLRYGGAKGGAEEAQFGLLAGKAWEGGRLVVGYEINRRDALAASKRGYVTADLRSFGGGDYRSLYSSPGTIFTGGRYYAIPAGQNGVGLRADQLIANKINYQDGRVDTDILPRQTRQALYVRAEQDLGARTSVFGQLLVADRRTSFRALTTSQSAVTVPVTNPFYVDPIGTHQPVRVLYSFIKDLGPNLYAAHVRAYDGAFGVRQMFGSWSASASLGFGRQDEDTLTKNYVNTYRLGLAVADTNPATAYNLFGDAGSTNAATIESIRGFAANFGVYQALSADLKADGPLFDLPAGSARLAVGLEHRDERYRLDSLNYISTAAPSASRLNLPGPRQVDAGFAELLLPLVDETMNMPGVRQLKASLAGRIERYSDFGVTRNPKIGLDWSPLRGVTLKSAYGTSFRAPSFYDMRQGVGSGLYQPVSLSDPNAASGSTVVLALIGNKPGTGPERAKTWTTTAEWKPATNLKLSATYFQVRYRDRISSINGDIYNALINRASYAALLTDNPDASVVAGYYASPYFSNPLNIAASSIKVIVDARVQNLAVVDEDGVDLDIDYRRALGWGQLSLGLAATYVMSVEQAVTDGSPRVESVGTVGNPVRLRWRLRSGLSVGPWDLAGFVNFTDGYRNQTVTPNEHIDAWTTVDLNLGYRFETGRMAGLRASLALSNLFDKDPPYANMKTSTSGIGFDSDNASPIGRSVAVQLTKAW
ncbi:TonB-dependent receptor [Caulobacter hibisci]|uniref:TonB-dependent receptor n=1 Tax=Caulobacter hibisci TaxID=2035993 RepID=A0ABS0SX54_9CAUL|nr:TonB-dependent receptor [Caulobacter hibisci]MBI1684222.1 TonB-dependent receptor [Caulobacter hibisci]